MGIMLGNLTISQIEDRTGVELSDADKTELSGMRQEKAENIAPGKWHCFDLPFMIVCGDKPTAEKVVKFFHSMIGRKQNRHYRFRGRGEHGSLHRTGL